VVRGDDLVAAHPDCGDVGDVALESGDLPGPVHEALVNAAPGTSEFHEPVLLHGPGTIDDLLRAFDLLVEGVVVSPVSFRGVMVNHPSIPGISPDTHDPFRLQGGSIVEGGPEGEKCSTRS